MRQAEVCSNAAAGRLAHVRGHQPAELGVVVLAGALAGQGGGGEAEADRRGAQITATRPAPRNASAAVPAAVPVTDGPVGRPCNPASCVPSGRSCSMKASGARSAHRACRCCRRTCRAGSGRPRPRCSIPCTPPRRPCSRCRWSIGEEPDPGRVAEMAGVGGRVGQQAVEAVLVGHDCSSECAGRGTSVAVRILVPVPA